MVDIALWYDTKGAGGSVRGRPSALRFGAAKREPSAGLPAQPRRTRGGTMSFWGERRSARCHTQAVCAWGTRPVRSRASIRSSRESRPGSPRAGPMLRRVTRPCLGITTMLCRRSGFGSVPQCSHATRGRSVPTNGASTSTERTTTPARSPHDAEKMSRTSAAPTLLDRYPTNTTAPASPRNDERIARRRRLPRIANTMPIGAAVTMVTMLTAMTVAITRSRNPANVHRPRGEFAHAAPRERVSFAYSWKHFP